MDRGAWWAAVHGVAKSRARLSDFTFTFHFHALEKEMATHSSILAWRIPGTGVPSRLLSLGLHRVGHDWSDLAAAAAAAAMYWITHLSPLDSKFHIYHTSDSYIYSISFSVLYSVLLIRIYWSVYSETDTTKWLCIARKAMKVYYRKIRKYPDTKKQKSTCDCIQS